MTMPFSTPMAIAIFFTMWWIVLFAILPFGVRSQHEGDEMIPGTDPGAPIAPKLAWKAFWTTIGAAICFVGLVAYVNYLA